MKLDFRKLDALLGPAPLGFKRSGSHLFARSNCDVVQVFITGRVDPRINQLIYQRVASLRLSRPGHIEVHEIECLKDRINAECDRLLPKMCRFYRSPESP